MPFAHRDPGFDLPHGNGMLRRVQLPFEVGDFIQDLPPRRIQVAENPGLHVWRHGGFGVHALCKKSQGLRINGIRLRQPTHAVGELAGAERVDNRDRNPGLVNHRMGEAVIRAGGFQCHKFDAMPVQLQGESLYGLLAVSCLQLDSDRVDENVQSVLTNVDTGKG